MSVPYLIPGSNLYCPRPTSHWVISGDEFDRFIYKAATDDTSIVADVQEFDEHYLVTAELPGVLADDIEVTYENERLTILATRAGAAAGSFHVRERSSKPQKRVFPLKGVNPDGVVVSLKNGLLSVSLPKAAPYIAKRYQVLQE